MYMLYAGPATADHGIKNYASWLIAPPRFDELFRESNRNHDLVDIARLDDETNGNRNCTSSLDFCHSHRSTKTRSDHLRHPLHFHKL